MENESKIEDQEGLLHANDYFKLDFPGQNLKGNKLYEDFKKRKLKELGNDAKLFYCKRENLYFYKSKNECKEAPFYYKICPSCNHYVCYFCKRNSLINIADAGNCCIILKINYLLLVKGFILLKGLDQLNEEQRNQFRASLIMASIPFFGFIKTYVLIFDSLFFGLLLKDKKYKNNFDENAGIAYEEYLCDNYHESIIVLIIIATGVLLSICFILYDFYFKLVLLIISLFSKFYPFKYIMGIYSFA